jgi:hypothetical protein
MRVDETKIPEGKRVNVCCPYCKHLGPIRQTAPENADGAAATIDSSPTEPVKHLNADPERPGAPLPAPSPGPAKTGRPPHILDDFRFPAEVGAAREYARPRKKGMGRTLFIAASIGVVLAVAILVNIVLLGPSK